jgi:S-adenosylmethionine/arginine decarboxylase-like enzyme
MEEYWGYHLMCDVARCDIDKARDPEYIKKFISDLVDKIDMIPHGEPIMVHFAKDTPKAGWTAFQLIETSNITAHFLDNNGDLYLDIFSCKNFNEHIVLQMLTDYFDPKEVQLQFIPRQA